MLSGSDDCTIKIWDADSGAYLTDLNGHKNAVSCMTLANNELFSGSLDHYVRIWDLPSIDEKIYMLACMAAEDIRSRKLRRMVIPKKGKGGKGAAKGSAKKGKK